MSVVQRWLHASGWVTLAACVLGFVGLVGIYTLNWLVFHPKLVTVFLRAPLFGTPHPADVIVVLAQDVERTRYAEWLVERGFAPRILSTLVDTACLHQRVVQEFCATNVRNTVDEALAMRRILIREEASRVLIVTSRDHVVRAAAIFTFVFFGTGIDMHVVATPFGDSPSKPSVREIKSFLPSLGGAVLGRFSPELYEWLMRYLRTLHAVHGNSNEEWLQTSLL